MILTIIIVILCIIAWIIGICWENKLAIPLILLAAFAFSLTIYTSADRIYKLSPTPKYVDSISYNMYRGYKVSTGELTPIYIPKEDDIFLAADTISINNYGTYTPNSKIKAVIGIYRGIIKFKDDSLDNQ